MSDEHLSLETLADWLSGELEQERMLAQVVPHFLAGCPICRERYEEILRMQAEVGHWNESLVVREAKAAPALLAELLALPFEERWRRVAEDPTFQAWGLCQLLLQGAARAVHEDPAQAVDLAELAVKMAEELGIEAYHPAWVADLQARAWAHLGNAQRVLGELRSAEVAFRRAADRLTRGSTGDPRVAAEILSLEASLLSDRRRFAEAQKLLDRAIAIHQDVGDGHWLGRALLKKAKVLEEAGVLDRAIDLLWQVPSLLNGEREPRLILLARQNLLGSLIRAARFTEAESLLPEVRQLCEEIGVRADRRRLRWAEGLIAHSMGRTTEAEAVLREVQEDFFAEHLGYDAVLVAMDLAVLYAEAGATEELKRLSAEVTPVFESQEVQREAMAALILFQSACQEEALTAGLARDIAQHLRYERYLPGARVREAE